MTRPTSVPITLWYTNPIVADPKMAIKRRYASATLDKTMRLEIAKALWAANNSTCLMALFLLPNNDDASTPDATKYSVHIGRDRNDIPVPKFDLTCRWSFGAKHKSVGH